MEHCLIPVGCSYANRSPLTAMEYLSPRIPIGQTGGSGAM
jgi:hypothetical protein